MLKMCGEYRHCGFSVEYFVVVKSDENDQEMGWSFFFFNNNVSNV